MCPLLSAFRRTCPPAWTSEDLHRLQRRCRLLTSLLGKLQWPRIMHFHAFGKMHRLPVRAQPGVQKLPLQHELEYMVGFFDGDGCVHHGLPRTGCALSIGQSCEKGEVLLRFCQALGGGIYRHAGGKGLCKPVIMWSVQTPLARQAAAVLGRLPSLKQQQLLMASEWPSSAKQRAALQPIMQQLKREEPSEASLCCTWGYLAGFFDAEGCIRVKPVSTSVTLELSQRSIAILNVIRDFVLEKVPGASAMIYPSGRYFSLQMTSPQANIMILRRLLAAGLEVKRAEAYVALGLCSSNHADVREGLAQLKGNQSRYMRLDSAGCLRAKAINNSHGRLRYALVRGGREVADLEHQLGELKHMHNLGCTRTRLATLRADIRALLRLGASQVGSPNSPTDSEPDGQLH
ncbi:unnamed protein product [Polarella glacialis]|uniref:LAGLIDADG endonuclease n=1 Tax=Polarella glacialis TaxID=89957 RepID=A0A813LML6_POLGL|nr:unnamed protein product [Polarella glacialis]CAE8733686.1 unnamed protein product [Polarella glacialis]